MALEGIGAGVLGLPTGPLAGPGWRATLESPNTLYVGSGAGSALPTWSNVAGSYSAVGQGGGAATTVRAGPGYTAQDVLPRPVAQTFSGSGQVPGTIAPNSAGESAAGTNQPAITLYGFRGAGSTQDLLAADAPHPYVVTGHVGYSFDGGQQIFGFGPKVPVGMSVYDAVQSLRNGANYPGIITDDTALFRSVAENPAVGRGGVPQVVIQQKIPVSQADFDAIKAAHDAVGINNPINNVSYGFPGKNVCTFNCATFPSSLGIPIPEASGNMRLYFPELEKLGQPWVPK
ncbi:hypothetical protein LMG9673_04749 [Ralstonia pseudosolanacearum]|nr:hypothetical protein LMG9673_04749 [Ralstonia pseudosolanacearum]